MSLHHDEGHVTQRAVPGPALYFKSTMPEGAPKAVLGLLHGYADHAARYDHVAKELAEAGIGVVAIDMRGHGRAQGVRGFCSRFDEFLDDAEELVRLVDDRAKGAPRFLFGHSFGGLVASRSVLDSPGAWRGLLLSAPFFGLALEVPAAKILAGKIASRIVPKLGLSSGLHGRDMTHDPVRARSYDEDPLVFKKARARWFTETTQAQADVLARARNLRIPFYEMFGSGDKVASFASGKAFFDAASSEDKTWDPKEGLFHEILNEPSYRESAATLAAWILQRAR